VIYCRTLVNGNSLSTLLSTAASAGCLSAPRHDAASLPVGHVVLADTCLPAADTRAVMGC